MTGRRGTERAAAIAIALWACAAQAQLTGAARLTGETGYDSNARHDFLETGAVPDLFAQVLLALEGRGVWDRVAVSGGYDAGARAFALLPEEDTLAQAGTLEASWRAFKAVSFGVDGSGKLRLGGERSYGDLAGTAFVAFDPDPHVDARVHAGAHRFVYWPALGYSFGAPEATASARYRFDRRHSVTVFASWESRAYADAAHASDGTALSVRRADSVLSAGVSYAFRGPFTLTAGYAFLGDDSNSFGQSQQRHRFSLTAGFRLPWGFVFLLDAALQLANYPDGVFLSPSLILLEDNENASYAVARLVRPLGEHFELQATYGVYYGALPANDLTYFRQVGSVGIGFRL